MTLPKRQNQEVGVAVPIAGKIALMSFVVASESLCLNVGGWKGRMRVVTVGKASR